MSVDVYDGTEPDPRCTCRVVHGNADDDGECNHCARLREQREAENDEPGDSYYEDTGKAPDVEPWRL